MSEDATRREGLSPLDQTVREVALSHAEQVTLREGDASVPHLNLVPGAAFLRYVLVKPLEVTSGEADLWFVRRGETEYVLKLYRYGITPKAALTEKLRGLAAQHVVKVEEHGTLGNRAYEVLEKIPHGDLRKLPKPCPEARLKEMLRELSEAVSHLHAEGIIHRDLKPGNILLRSLEPLDLVLTDFGIASLSEATLHLTNANRTAMYSAPEALTGVVSGASDWWSVGVMVLEFLQGVHPLAGMNEQVVNFQLVSKGIVVPEDLPAEWGELLRGLLTRDHQKRWQGEQVREWLAGKRQQATHYESEHKAAHTHKPFQFRGRDLYTVTDVATALREDWDNAVKHLGRGFLANWVGKELDAHELASRLLDLGEDSQLSPDERLSLALLELNPGMPGVWKGNVVNREWAARAPEEFVSMLESRIRARLEQCPGWPGELVGQLGALQGRKLAPEARAALQRVLCQGSPELRLGDWGLTPESLAAKPGPGAALLESELPSAYRELTGNSWLAEAAQRWQQVRNAGPQRNCFWAWVCTGEPRVVGLEGQPLAPGKLTAGILEGPVPALWQRLTGQSWLAAAAAAWNEMWPRVKALGCETEPDRALPWLLGEAGALKARAQELRRRYTGASLPALNALWEKDSWDLPECVALCAAEEGTLLTAEEKRVRDGLRRLTALGVDFNLEVAEGLLRANDPTRLAKDLAWADEATVRKVLARDAALGGVLGKDPRKREFVESVALVARLEAESFKQALQAEIGRQRRARRRRVTVVVAGLALAVILAAAWVSRQRAEAARVKAAAEAKAAHERALAAAREADERARAEAKAAEEKRVAEIKRQRDEAQAAEEKAQAEAKAKAEAEARRLEVEAKLAQERKEAGLRLLQERIAATAKPAQEKRLDWVGRALRRGGMRDELVQRLLVEGGSTVAWGAQGRPVGLGGLVQMTERLALRSNGTVLSWNGGSWVPPDLCGVVSVASGSALNLALRADGTVVAWGLEAPADPASTNQAKFPPQGFPLRPIPGRPLPGVPRRLNPAAVPAVPAGLSNVVAIAAGGGHGLALRANGTVVAWGENRHGQASVPDRLADVVAIAAGEDHSLALRADGTVVAWGNNSVGQTDVPANLAGVVSIAAGRAHNLALCRDGSVVGWGHNEYGQVKVRGDLGADLDATYSGELWIDKVKRGGPADLAGLRRGDTIVDGNGVWSALLKSAPGEVLTFEAGREGGTKKKGARKSYTVTLEAFGGPPPNLKGVVALAAGNSHSLALRGDGTVVAWGYNDDEQCAVPAGLDGVAGMVAGDAYSLVLRLAAPASSMVDLTLRSGEKLAGSIQSATDQGFVLLLPDGKTYRGGRVPWSELTPESAAKLAGQPQFAPYLKAPRTP